ncbi:hypothetical protein PybrP1_006531 [[Pythium] brassicae (nom. inval.)]|nr:hypothetical protein PybrP1_006531 [[Pythium] brassicae (nom. inval.)]
MRKSIVRVGSTVGGRARGASRVSMAQVLPETPENGRLLFAGRLLSMGDDVQIQQGAIEFLQRLAEPVVVVSVHGAQGSGKSATVRSLLASGEDEDEVDPFEWIPEGETEDVWLYVKRVDATNAKYLAVLDRPGFGNNEKRDALVYSILAGLSSVVIHHVDGELSPDAIGRFAFLAQREGGDGDDTRLKHSFPQSPKLLWLLTNVSTSDLKERVGGKSLSIQEVEQTYLRNALCEVAPGSSAAFLYDQLLAHFSDQTCYSLPASTSSAFTKRVEKLAQSLVDSGRNRYLKGVLLNGPLFSSILVSMLAHRPNPFKAFKGRIWKDTIHNCCLNIVESGIKLYKLRMAQQLGRIVDTSDLDGYVPVLTAPMTPLTAIELPCDTSELLFIHSSAKRFAKATLKTMPVRSGKLNALLQKLFKDLVESLFEKIQDENKKISSEFCRALLAELHADMSAAADKHLQTEPEDEDMYSFQSTGFKQFFSHYQAHLIELMGQYSDRALGSCRRHELSYFLQHTIRAELLELTEKLEKIRHHDVAYIEESIEECEKRVQELNENQRLYQKEAMSVQADVNKQLVEVAKIQALRKEALEGAIENVDAMHQMATTQRDMLEEAAFVSVQLPSERVIEAAQETEVMELQGYLIKQGGGGNAFNPLGRRNWKQRYFILIGTSLAYAKTKDDYERGRIIKELNLAGCRIEQSRDAGEGFEIVPPPSGKQSHVYEVQKGFFDKNRRKRSSHSDSKRVFKLRAQTIEERDAWMSKLRLSVGLRYSRGPPPPPSKRAGDAAPKSPVAKKSRVKVVASRYAQTLQRRNLETQRAQWPAVGASGGSTSLKTKQPLVVPSALALAKQGPPPATASASTEPLDLKERLKAYKASKAAPAVHATTASASAKPKSKTTAAAAPPARLHTAPRERPGLPSRIERSAKRPAKVASEPIPVETTRPSSAGGSTPRARAASFAATSASAAASAVAPHQTEQEELELLEALYYQLCFAERRAEQAFRQQEQSAEASDSRVFGSYSAARQILAAWNVFQSKLQLLHDTSLRLDREKHAQLADEHLADQVNPSVQAASRLPALAADLSAVCSSVEASLHRLPTRGVRCDPADLLYALGTLSAQLDGLLQQVQGTKLDAKIADALAFSRGMEQAAEAASASLLQVAHLVEELRLELDAETSLAIERIQRERLARASDHDGDDDW